MLFDKETRYWQEEYRKGNLDDEDMPGEIRAVLDGSAEKMIIPSLIFSALIIGMVFYFVG